MTSYAYAANGVFGAGQVSEITDPLSKKTYFRYDAVGRQTHTWGDVPQPTWNEYNAFGERIALHTYRTNENWSGANWPAGDVTTWLHDTRTGLLEKKTDAAGKFVQYEYTGDGRLKKRKWARTVAAGGDPVTTEYAYQSTTGDLTGVTYNDGTPPVTLTYDRRWRIDAVDQGGASGLDYDYIYTNWPAELSVNSSSGSYTQNVTERYDAAAGGQLTSIVFGTFDPQISWSHDSATGRLRRVRGPGLPTGALTGDPNWGLLYDYLPGTDLVQNITLHRRTTGTHSAPYRTWRTVRTFEAYRDVLRAVAHYHNPDAENGQSTLVARYDYARIASPTHGADELGRRTDLKYEGAAFPATLTQTFGHNDRSELTSTTRGQAGLPTAWTYAYDPIGNRTQSTFDPPPAGSPEATNYTANAVNAYTVTVAGAARGGLRYDADGNLVEQFVSGDSDCDGSVTFIDIDYFVAALGGEAAWAALYAQNHNGQPPPCPYLSNDLNGDGVVNFIDIDPLVGSIGTTGPWVQYAWDGENRLTGVTPMKPDANSRKVAYAYDYLGRRVERRVYSWSGTAWNTTPIEQTRYVWGGSATAGGPASSVGPVSNRSTGWLLLMELDGLNGNAVRRRYTWGLDLAGQNGQPGTDGDAPASLENAGGIGGLLAVDDTLGTAGTSDDVQAVFVYDGNGNVGQVVKWNAANAADSLIAKYEYDPYGNVIAQSGGYAAVNTFRFSTKQWDDATGLGYWGRRYYLAKYGRWVNRDPIGERGGLHLYSYSHNVPPLKYDPIGLSAISRPPSTDLAMILDPSGWLPQENPFNCGTGFPEYLSCSAYCDEDEVKELFRKKGNPDGMVVCRADGPACACANPNIDPKTAGGRKKKECVHEHEIQHIDEGISCWTCFNPPCMAGHGAGNWVGECGPYAAQLRCLIGKFSDADCDADCRKELRAEIAIIKMAVRKFYPGCSNWFGGLVCADDPLCVPDPPEEAERVP